MRYLKICMLMAFVAAFAVSCSDSTTNPTVEIKNYFVFNQNSSWKYQDSSYANDSSKITHSDAQSVGQQQYMNRNADVVAEQQVEDGSRDTNYYYVDNKSKLYTSLYFVLPSDLSSLGINSQLFPNQWILIADQNSTSWDIINLPLTDQSIEIQPGTTVNFTGNLIIKGGKAGTKTFTVKSNQITAQEFTVSLTLKGTAKYSIAQLPIDFTVTTHLYFAENIGLVGYVVDSTSVNLSILGNLPINGSSRILTDYTIATAN